MHEITVTLLDDDEELPPDVEIEPDFMEMETEEAVRHLMEHWGLGEVDARFHLAIARGEIDGDAYPVDDNGQRVRKPRQHHTTV